MIRARYYVGTRPVQSAEDVDMPALLDRMALVLALNGVQGATLLPALGVWEGEAEGTVVVEILSEGSYVTTEHAEQAAELAERLRAAGDQNAVLWTLEPVSSGMAER